jgi:hypothetical protein
MFIVIILTYILINIDVSYINVAGSIPDGVNGFFNWQSFRSHYGPGVDSASNRNEYQKYFLEVKAAGV